MIESTHVPGQQYLLEQISFVVQELILNARTGFRGASRVVDSVARIFGLNWEVPHHTTCRTRLLRIGLFQLRHPKDMTENCFWIVNHTVQVGQEKCLLQWTITNHPWNLRKLRHQRQGALELLIRFTRLFGLVANITWVEHNPIHDLTSPN